MVVLYHFPLSPLCRKLRIILKEKNVNFELISENFWERRKDFLKLTPAANVPVFIDNEKNIIYEGIAAAEYIEEIFPQNSLYGESAKERADVRIVSNWFDIKFNNEVTRHIVEEKVIKFLKNSAPPSSNAIRAGKTNIVSHINYIAFLLKNNKWLAGDFFSAADITAASHLSALDYLGDVPWEQNEAVKEWYAIVKSRPSFRPILSDRVPGFKPAKHYSDLDF